MDATTPQPNRRALATIIGLCGGATVFDLADRHFRDRESLDELAATSGTSRSAVHRRVTAMYSTLAMADMLPAGWRRRKPGRIAKPKTVSVESRGYLPDARAVSPSELSR